MQIIEVVLQVMSTVLIVSFLWRLARGEESIRDERGQLRPLAAVVAIGGGFLLVGLIGVAVARIA